MDHLTRFRGPVLAAAAYFVVATILLGPIRMGGLPPLVWLPSGIAIAALLATPMQRWPTMLGALFIAQFASMSFVAISTTGAIDFSVAHSVEAAICAFVGVQTFKQPDHPRYASLGRLFMVALLAASLSASIAQPFRSTPGVWQYVHWLLGHALGILSFTPIALFLHDRFWPLNGERRLAMMVTRPGLPFATVALFALSVAVLVWLPGPLLLLVGFAIVASVIRYGQLAASTGVLAYAAAALILRYAGVTLPGLAGMDPLSAAVILQLSMLVILITSVPIAAFLDSHGQLQARLKEQNVELGESLQVLTMAEKLVGMGRWRLNVRTGRQQWSPAMLEMNGLDPAIGPDPGDVTALLPDGGATLFSSVAEHREAREPYTIDYTIRPEGGSEQFLRMVVSNEFDEEGQRIAVFGVALDITGQVQRERALQAARQHALELAAQAQQLALTDPLTGLANRRAIFEQLSRLAMTSPQQRELLTVILFDIDHFKRVNDTHGHQTGDAVLQRIAELARREVRGEDLIGRIGGEEFVWLLPDVDIGRARDLAERLRETIERESASDGLPRVTVSLGMALLRQGDTPEQLIARADEALYRAKESGRNCVRRAA